MPHEPSEVYGVRGGARTTQRRGRMSAAKRAVLESLGPRWLCDEQELDAPGGVARAFGHVAPVLVDIGGGTGQATRAWALEHPDHDVLAIELHRPGIVRLVRDLEASGPANIRIVEGDATSVIERLPSGSLAGLRVLFPDPWPKRRHVARRLVDPAFVRQVTDLLAVGGAIHVATDWLDYADQMRSALATEPRLTAMADLEDRSAPEPCAGEATTGETDVVRWRTHRPDRPLTAYEQRGIDAGRTITDLVAHRTG